MLEYLRNAAEKPVAKILIGILAFSFVGWGVAEWIFGNVAGNNSLVTVGGQEITLQQFNAERSREMAKLTKEQQRALYADSAAMEQTNAKVISTLATQQMAENRADDLGFVVSDRRIAREIREFPEFQSGGRFSTLMFDSVLNASGYTEAQFADVLRGQVLRSMVLGAMAVPMDVPQFAVDAAYKARYGQRTIEYTVVPFADFKVANPTDAQLAEFYAKNPHTVPETRAVSYVLVAGDLSKPDVYDKTFEVAQRVEDEIIAGESMSAAASKHKAKFVGLKAFSADKRPVDAIMTDKMVAKIFEMDEGTESELIETKQGFVIVRVEKVNPSHNAELADVKNNLIADWQRDQQRTQAYVRANEIVVDAKADKAMPNKKNVTVTRMSGAPTDVLVAAFKAGVGDVVVVPGADAFYALRVTGDVAPKVDTKKMADVRKELQNMSARGVMDDYNSFLMRQYPVKLNEKLYNKFLAK